jgi:hypothetical protein
MMTELCQAMHLRHRHESIIANTSAELTAKRQSTPSSRALTVCAWQNATQYH